MHIGVLENDIYILRSLFLSHTAIDTRKLGNLLTSKSRHPDMSGLSAASGCFCTVPPVPC